jgi:MFS family permease
MSPLRIALTALLPFASGYFMSYLLRAVNAVVAPDLVRDAGLSPGELGLLTAAYLGAFGLFQLPLGVLLDRYGPRKVQTALLCIAAMGCMGFAAAPGFFGLLAARAVIGLGFSAGLMASYKSSSIWVPIERRSFANAAIMSFGALGVVVATEPTEFLVTLVGWRNTFAIFAAFIFAAALLIFSLAPRADTAKSSMPLRGQFADMMAIVRLPLFRRVAPLLGLTAGVQIGIQTLWVGPWFRDVMGLTREDVARHLLWMALAFMVGILSVGIIADRLGRRGVSAIHVMLGFNIIYFIAQALIVFQVKAVAMPAWLAVAAFGQVTILAFPWFAARVGPDIAGRSNATINFSMFAAAFASQYIVGLIIGLFPATATGYDPRGYSWAIGFFLVLQLLAFVWYLTGAEAKEAQNA